MARATAVRHHQKRQGHHQKRSKHFLRTYAPYIPLTLIVLSNLLVGFRWQLSSKPSVLAYATEMSIPNLLSSTNSARNTNGVASLAVNAKLNNAAQTKANDMAARNYWSHNTPEGTPPWVFISNAGYSYSRAGENLAYGFATSADTVVGWMNSPAHRENILNSGYTEVGFGIVNAPNYNNSGQETLVVAMYGAPYNAPKAAAPAPKASQPTQTVTQQSGGGQKSNAPITSRTVQVTVSDTAGKPVANVEVTLHSDPKVALTDAKGVATFTGVELGEHTAIYETEAGKTEKKVAVDGSSTDPIPVSLTEPLPGNQTTAGNETTAATLQTKTVSRLQVLTRGSTPWIMSAVILGAITGAVYLVLKHGLKLHKLLVRGEKYVMKHMLLDVTIVSFLLLCYMVSRGAGIIL